MQSITSTDKGTLLIVEKPDIDLAIHDPLPLAEIPKGSADVLAPHAHEHGSFDYFEDEPSEREIGM